MARRERMAAAVGEAVAWWAGLMVLWLMLISSVDPLEVAVGAGAAALAALLARGARRAVTAG